MSIQEVNQKRTSLFQWLVLPKEQRFPSTYVEKARELHVTTQTLINWEAKYFQEWKRQQKGNGAVDITSLSYEDMVALWKKIMVELMQGDRGTAEDRKTFGKYLGILTEKTEHTLKRDIDADEYFRIREEAKRRLGQFSRDRGLLPESALLSVEIREGEGQTEGDNPV